MKVAKLILGVLLTAGLVGSAQAVINTDLYIGDSYYLGSIKPGTPSSPADEVVFINFLIDMSLNTTIIDAIVQSGEDNDVYRSSNNFGALSDATVDGAHTDNSAGNSYGYSGYDYFLAKYGKNSYVWYVGALSGTYNVGATSIGSGGGLSHTAGFTSTSVPDGSMTVALLGIGLAGLTVVSRMFHV